MIKNIHSIQFLGDRIIIEFEQGRIFQFCRDCKHGRHIKTFLQAFGDEIDFESLDTAAAIYLEKRFYFELSRGAIRRFIKRELHELIETYNGKLKRKHLRQAKAKNIKYTAHC